jgi:hypothetical protein
MPTLRRNQRFLSPFLKNPPNRLDFFKTSAKAKLFIWASESPGPPSNGLGAFTSFDQWEVVVMGPGLGESPGNNSLSSSG